MKKCWIVCALKRDDYDHHDRHEVVGAYSGLNAALLCARKTITYAHQGALSMYPSSEVSDVLFRNTQNDYFEYSFYKGDIGLVRVYAFREEIRTECKV